MRLVAAAVVVAACSRGGAHVPQLPTAIVDAVAPDASSRSAPSGGRDGAAAALPSLGEDEGSGAQEISLKEAPLLTIRPVGPALIEVTVGDDGRASWTKIEVERRALSADARQHATFERTATRSRTQRGLHAAKPGTEYAYRARAGGEWSREVTVRTPEPHDPPKAPGSLAAQATGAFEVRLAWEANAGSAAGFEIEVEAKGQYVRAALVDPTVRAYVHNNRLPGRSYTYRVRAFNARGASAPSPVASVTTVERVEPQSATKLPLPPCIRLPREADPDAVNGMPRMVLNGAGGRPLYNDPEGTNGTRRHLIGEYAGCFRDFGAFDLQADVMEVPGFANEGWPLLRAIAGAGQYVGAQILTLRFSRGRYTVVNDVHFCGEPWPEPDPDDPHLGTEGDGPDLTQYSPPFEGCQRDRESH